jgi:hypothetical protein
MKHQVRFVILIQLILLTSLAAWGAPRAGAEAQTTKPIDPWKAYVKKGLWQEGSSHFRKALIDLCRADDTPSAKKVADRHRGYLVCNYFPAIERAVRSRKDRKRFVSWLLEEKTFTYDLLLYLNDGDDIVRMWEIVYALRRKSRKTAERYRNLVIAFAVVWDSKAPRDRPLLDAYSHYTSNASKMRVSVRSMPPDILQYVVDSERSREERKWAFERFRSISDVERLYKMPKYDVASFETGSELAIDKHEQTLQNILKYGGVCRHQAVFAADVGKACGTPTVFIGGGSSSGLAHAWVGYLRKRGKRYIWDRDTGRIGKESVTYGMIRYPQSGRQVPVYLLELSLRALEFSESKRRGARMWRQVAQLLGADAPKAAARAIKRSIKEGCLEPEQWQVYAALAAAGVFSSKEVDEAIGGFANELKDHPGLAADATVALIQSRKKDSTQANLRRYDRAAKRFKKHESAYALVRLAQGRYLEALGKTRDAEKVYAEAALATAKCRSITLVFLDAAARLMLADNRVKDAAAFHKAVHFRAPPLERSSYAVYATRFAIDLRWAKMELRAGRKKEHDRILGNIVSKYKIGREGQRILLQQLKKARYDDFVRR